jgi:flagellar hook-length control protein FliK
MKQAMGNDFGRVRIVLDPPNLGSVDLEIVVRKEKVEVVMATESASVQQALQSRTDDIRSALQRQDLKVENFQVLLQSQGDPQQQTQGEAMFAGRQERQGHPSSMSRQEEESPATALTPPPTGGERVDGRLSFFA